MPEGSARNIDNSFILKGKQRFARQKLVNLIGTDAQDLLRYGEARARERLFELLVEELIKATPGDEESYDNAPSENMYAAPNNRVREIYNLGVEADILKPEDFNMLYPGPGQIGPVQRAIAFNVLAGGLGFNVANLKLSKNMGPAVRHALKERIKKVSESERNGTLPQKEIRKENMLIRRLFYAAVDVGLLSFEELEYLYPKADK